VIEEVEAAAPTALVPGLRNLLGAFLFRGDDILKPLDVLSGGERSRLALLGMLLRPANLLILDEPTNHLDIASQQVLADALEAFSGTVVFVSHDRDFIERLATVVLELRDGAARWFPGGYEYYLRKTGQEAGEEAAPAPEAATERTTGRQEPTASELERQEQKRLKARVRSLEREEASILARLESLDADLRRIEGEMARPEVYADGRRMQALSRTHADNRREHDGLIARWEELDRELAPLKDRGTGAGAIPGTSG
jgi:ATP-binding cassette subfamily F protein 3